MAPWFVGTDLSGSASTPTTQNCRRYDAHSEDVASLPSGYGPRVQLFGVRVPGAFADRAAVPAELRSLIDPMEDQDQVRIYPTTTQTFSQRYILGARTVEERSDYWIVR